MAEQPGASSLDAECEARIDGVIAAAHAWRAAKVQADLPEATPSAEQERDRLAREYRHVYAAARAYIAAHPSRERMRQLRELQPPPRSAWEGFVRWIGID